MWAVPRDRGRRHRRPPFWARGEPNQGFGRGRGSPPDNPKYAGGSGRRDYRTARFATPFPSAQGMVK